MFIIRINPQKPDSASIGRAIAVLKRGGLVVYPTETAYALGGDATNADAVKKIFAAKKRDPSKPLPLIVHDDTTANRSVLVDSFSRVLMNAFWPGPLTLIVKAKNSSMNGVASRTGEVAVRVSPHPVARALAKALGRPIVSTSANRSGGGTHYRIAGALADLGTLPDLVLDAGPLPPRPPSTIVRCRAGRCDILRSGPISPEMIRRALSAC